MGASYDRDSNQGSHGCEPRGLPLGYPQTVLYDLALGMTHSWHVSMLCASKLYFIRADVVWVMIYPIFLTMRSRITSLFWRNLFWTVQSIIRVTAPTASQPDTDDNWGISCSDTSGDRQHRHRSSCFVLFNMDGITESMACLQNGPWHAS